MDWDPNLPEDLESTMDSSFDSEQLSFQVMLGDAITRPTVPSPYPATFRMQGTRDDRNTLFEFWKTAGGEFFSNFPHPILGMVDARFPADIPPTARNLKGMWYEMEFNLEIRPTVTPPGSLS